MYDAQIVHKYIYNNSNKCQIKIRHTNMIITQFYLIDCGDGEIIEYSLIINVYCQSKLKNKITMLLHN